jgi:RpiB/LacA/LacB family sugar-phosphate isomerase
LRIIIASDHIGFPLKQRIVEHLRSSGVQYLDAGPTQADNPVDFPDYAQLVARAVRCAEYDRGILVCGTGQGMAIAANRFPGIRAALCYNLSTATQSRSNNNANVLCLGNDELAPDDALMIVDTWLKAEFEGGRNAFRLSKVELYLSSMHREYITQKQGNPATPFKFSFATSPKMSSFSPLLFAGRLDDGLRFAAETGFDAVEISLSAASEIPPEIFASALSDKGLSLSAIATGRMCLEEGLCLSNPSAKVLSQVKERLFSLIELAAALKAAVIIGGVRGILTGSATEQNEQRSKAVTILHDCADLASNYGVTMLIEPINRYETNFINSLRDAISILEDIDSPSVKLLLDTFHMNIEEADMFAAILSAGPKLGYIHIADNNRLAPGQGHINFPAILHSLGEIGYTGFLSAEILPLPDDVTALSQTSQYFSSVTINQETK